MATFNPADKRNSEVVLSNGNLTVTGTPSGPENPGQVNYWVRSNLNRSGKRYCEFTINTQYNSVIGIADTSTMTFPGANAQSFGLFSNGFGSINGTFPNWGGGTYNNFTTGDIMGMAVDLTAKLVWFRKNGGNWNGSALNNPATGTGGLNIAAYAGTTHYVVVSGDYTYATTANFGETAFNAAVPSGFLAWNAESVIQTTPTAMSAPVHSVTAGVFVRVVISGLNLGMKAKGVLPLTFGSASAAPWGLHTSMTMTQQGAGGDLNLMLALISATGVPPTITPPAGWTQVFAPSMVSDGTTGLTFYAWTKKTAAGDGNQTFTHSSANSIGWMPSISGVAGTPIEVQSAMASGTGFTTTATGLTTVNANDMLIMMAHDWNAGAVTRNNPTGAAWLEVTDSILYAAYVMPAAAGVQPNAVMTNANIVGQPWQAKMIALQPEGVTVTTTSRVSHLVSSPALNIYAGDASIPGQVINLTTNFTTAQTSTPTVNLGASSTIISVPAMTASTQNVDVVTNSILSIADVPAMTISTQDVFVDAFFPASVDIIDMPSIKARYGFVEVSIPIVFNATSPFMLMSTQDVVASIKPIINITAMPAMTASTQTASVTGKANVDITNIAMTVSTQTVGVVGKSIATLASVPSMSAPVSGVTIKVGQTVLVTTNPALAISTTRPDILTPSSPSGWDHDRLDGPGSLDQGDHMLISPPSLVPTESFSTISHGSGTWYAEVTIGGNPSGYVGLYNEANDAGTEIVLSTGEVRQLPSGVITPTFAPIVSGDVIGIAYDGTDGTAWFRVNGGFWNNSPTQAPVA